jgi:uncharacterized protein (TIGR03437 family)
MSRHRLYLLVLLPAAFIAPLSAQVLSNATLNGNYYFRYLGALTDDNFNSSARSFQGTLTFDGNGKYTVTGQGASGAVGGLRPRTGGDYNITGGGIFFMTNPVDSGTNPAFLFGGIGNGAIVASSTDTPFSDIFVAIPVSTTASNATLSGNYHVASLEFFNGDFSQTRDTFFSLAPDGAGGLGNVTIKGTSQALRSAPTTQTSTGATYTVSANGSGTLNLPAPSGVSAANTLLSGNKVLYVSSDGNLFLAGTNNGFDMVIGVKAFSGGAPNTVFSGLYFTTLLENYAAGTDADALYSAEGASNMLGTQNIELLHQRTNYNGIFSYDYSYGLEFPLAADGTFSGSSSFYGLGAGGNFLVGAGNGTNYQLTLYTKARPVSGTGVFLNPQAIVNAANNIPFTAQVSPGELVSAYGSGLAAQTTTATSLPFPTTLGGVQVMVNGTAAPIYYVSPTLVSFVIPFTAPDNGSFLEIQVNNAGTASNLAHVYSGQTSPGIFTLPPGGIGAGAILHADFTVVSGTSPAKAGETVQIFLTGLGKVNATVDAGAAGPSTAPFAPVVNDVEVYVGNSQARVTYAGLAPTLAGLYQLNVTLPTNIAAGNQPIEILTVDGDNYQATIAVGP